MTPEQRKAQAKAANQAATGRVPTLEERCQNAKTRQIRALSISPAETTLRQMLLDRGIETVPQQAVGPYNIDLAAYPVAIEIFGGGWHWSGEHAARYPKRIHYLLTEGWTVLAICVSKKYGVGLGKPLDEATADYVAQFIEHEQRVHPCNIRMYRAVRGAGEILALGIVKGDTVSITQTLKAGRDSLGRYTSIPSSD